MSKEKIETVLNFPLPKEVTSLRGFLGLANYFRQENGKTTSNDGEPKGT